jgi:hypothetical protein
VSFESPIREGSGMMKWKRPEVNAQLVMRKTDKSTLCTVMNLILLSYVR